MSVESWEGALVGREVYRKEGLRGGVCTVWRKFRLCIISNFSHVPCCPFHATDPCRPAAHPGYSRLLNMHFPSLPQPQQILSKRHNPRSRKHQQQQRRQHNTQPLMHPSIR